MSLRWRLALVFGALAGTVAAVVAGAAWVSATQELRGGVDDFLLARAEAAESGHGPFGGPAGDARRLDELSPGDERLGAPPDLDGVAPPAPGGAEGAFQVVAADGSVVVSSASDPLPVDDTDRAVARGESGRVLRDVEIDGVPFRLVTVPVPDGALQIARDLQEVEDALAGLRARLVALSVLATALAAGGGWLLARSLTRPLEELTDATERLALAEDDVEPIAVERTDEVGRLATSFNTTLEALAASRRQQTRLVMDASHELRTPLTTLRTNIELLARAPDLPTPERAEILADATAELEDLTRLVDELIELATVRRPGSADELDVDLGEVVSAVVSRGRRRYQRPIELTVVDPGHLRADPTALERAVGNLVDNAAKFSPAGTPVTVTVDGGTVTVADHGPGIPPPERERVFERFHRTDEARTLPGSGLGLAIVRRIAEQHGGTAFVEETPGGGATVTITLPVDGTSSAVAVESG